MFIHSLILSNFALVLLLSITNEVQAGFNGQLLKTYGNDTTVRVYSQELKNGSYYNTSTTAKAVQYTWSAMGARSNASTQTYQTFSLDLMQNVQVGQQGLSGSSLHEAMGAARGNLVNSTQMAMIEAYWDAHIANASKSANNASAFQIGLWELVNEQATSKSELDVLSGKFRVSSDQKYQQDVLALANSWLQNTDYSMNPTGDQPPVEQGQPLTPGLEPVVTPTANAVPVPPAIVLALSGLISMLVARGLKIHPVIHIKNC